MAMRTGRPWSAGVNHRRRRPGFLPPGLVILLAVFPGTVCGREAAGAERDPAAAFSTLQWVEVRVRPPEDSATPTAKRIRASKEKDSKLAARSTVQTVDEVTHRFFALGAWFEVAEGLPLPPVGMRVVFDAERDPHGIRVTKWAPYQRDNSWDKVEGPVTQLDFEGDELLAFEVAGLWLVVDDRTEFDVAGPALLPLIGGVDSDSRRAGIGISVGPFLMSGDVNLVTEVVSNGYVRGAADDDSVRVGPGLRLELRGNHAPWIKSYVQLRAEERFELTERNEWNRVGSGQVREAFLLLSRPDGKAALRIGRQKIEESREWLFDDALDGAMLYFEQPPFLVQAVGATYLFNPKPNEVRVRYGLLYGAVYPSRKLHAATYVLARSDDTRFREPIQYGVRALGRSRRWMYWVDAAIQRGVWQGRQLRASGFDIGGAVAAPLPGRPALIAGFARGSGDSNRGDGIDRTFRQPDLADNNDRFLGETSFRYYGFVLDPELSNLEILTIGTGLRPAHRSSLDIIYHQYRQANARRDLKSDLDREPTRRTGDIGHELDIVAALTRIARRWEVQAMYGRFVTGTAFAEPDQAISKLRLGVRYLF